ncbi:MAG: hypothetical protein V2I33_22335 [Kangiellaceae bacterium]|nr:hypothetical protein [Kangiellaceae bacterium]
MERKKKKPKRPVRRPQKPNRKPSEEEEPVQEMEHVAQRFLYKPGVPWPDLSPYLQQLIEIRIAKEFLSQQNK